MGKLGTEFLVLVLTLGLRLKKLCEAKKTNLNEILLENITLKPTYSSQFSIVVYLSQI